MTSIAIVGVSVELPSGNHAPKNLDHDAFFQLLLDGADTYQHMPKSRLNAEAWLGRHLGEIHVHTGAFLKDIDVFDNVEFGVSTRDARSMAPATRRLLENVFLALLDSGIDYRSRNVGCFTSATAFDLTSVTEPDEYDERGSFAGVPSMVANRISTHLDLLGPSVPTDTACSSTLTAFHLAVQSISQGECEAAVVAGCQLNHRFIDWFTYSQGSLLAKDGKCKPFDASADGFSRGEGCVAIVLKPLERALQDRDHIYATVLGTAINSSGGSAPPGAPVAEAQRAAMRQAFMRANRSFNDVDYVEMHATGTAKGDPTEANWIGAECSRDDELLVGSVKGNIGHTEIVAFLASLCKVLSVFKTGTIPPAANLHTLNPAIEWERYKLHAPTRATPLPCRSGTNSLVSIASSGIGGSNGHVVLEGPPIVPVPDRSVISSSGLALLMACGLSSRSAASIGQSLQGLLSAGTADLHALSTVLGRRAKQMSWRSYAVVEEGSLNAVSFSAPQHCPRTKPPILFLFSGQGPQHVDMGRELFDKFPIFRKSILDMDAVFARVTGKSIVKDHGLFSGTTAVMDGTWPISLILPSVAMFQMALFDLLVHLGVKPDAVMGHSAGETAVLYASGAAPKSMAIELAVLRGRVFSSMEDMGATMAAVSCRPDEAALLIDQVRKEDKECVLDIACHNAPSAVAISGHEVAIDRFMELALVHGYFCRKIRTRVPIHSSMMEHCRDEYVKTLHDLFDRYPGRRIPTVATYSTSTGELFEGPYDAEYFWNNTRNPVLFTHTIQVAALSSAATTIEISPHPVLSSYVSQITDNANAVFASTRRRKQGRPSTECRNLLELCGQLTSTGHNSVDFTALNGRACYELSTPLPEYPFQKKTFPLYPETPGRAKQLESHNGPLNHRYLKVNRETHPMLAEHVIRGEPIMPAAGFIEMALEFGATVLMDVDMRTILSLSSERPTKIDVFRDGFCWAVKTSILPGHHTTTSTERIHASGHLSFESPPLHTQLDIPAIRQRCEGYIGKSFYQSLAYFSAYGASFRRVTEVFYGYHEALVSIKGMDEVLRRDGRYLLHPAILDACLHITSFRPFHGDHNPNSYYLPAHVDAVILHRRPQVHLFPEHVYAHASLREWTPSSVYYDIVIAVDDGIPLCTLQGLEVAKHQFSPPPDSLIPYDIALQTPLVSTERKGTIKTNGSYYDNGYRNIEYCKTEKRSVNMGFDHSDALRKAVGELAPEGRRRVVRILFLGSDSSLTAILIRVLEEFSFLFFDIFIQKDTGASIDVNPRQGTIRQLGIDLSRPRIEHPGYFDIISMFHPDSGTQNSWLSHLLVPGGSLVCTIQPESPAANGHMVHAPPVSSQGLHTAGLSLRSTLLPPDGSSSILTAWYKKAATPVVDASETPVFDPDEAFVFHYAQGVEVDLQWDFSGLDPADRLDVWILTTQGRDGGAAVGLVRALRLEYLSWTLHVVVFPPSYDETSREGYLRTIPVYMREELDIFVTEDGHMLVPRMIPLLDRPSQDEDVNHTDVSDEAHEGSVIVEAQEAFDEAQVVWILGTECNRGQRWANASKGHRHQVIALSKGPLGEFVAVREEVTLHLSPYLEQYATSVLRASPGIVAAILAQGAHTFNNVRRCKGRRVLVTHSNTLTAMMILWTYQRQGMVAVEIQENATPLQLSSVLRSGFDMIVSGYTDAAYVELLKASSTSKEGRLYLWNDPRDGLGSVLRNDIWSVQDALKLALEFLGNHIEELAGKLHKHPVENVHRGPDVETSKTQRGVVFSPHKTYLVLGGIGNLGAHVAWMLYRHGARHIVVTSRRGVSALGASANRLVRRMFGYMQSLPDLDLRLSAIDASKADSLAQLLCALPEDAPLAGCLVLTANLADRTFARLEEADFKQVYESKIGVIDALHDCIDIRTLDFLVPFSSMAGLFGNGGQANYCAANTAMEEQVSAYPNAFAFVCPGIIDSTMMRAGNLGESGKIIQLEQFAQWGITAEEMVLWLEDALRRFQAGERFARYVPTVDWHALERTRGMPLIGRHLISDSHSYVLADGGGVDEAINVGEKMAAVVRAVLGIAEEDFSPQTPFTTYGVDSLSAARLAFMLRPYVEVTQLQLLADMSLKGLEKLTVTSEGGKEACQPE